MFKTIIGIIFVFILIVILLYIISFIFYVVAGTAFLFSAIVDVPLSIINSIRRKEIKQKESEIQELECIKNDYSNYKRFIPEEKKNSIFSLEQDIDCFYSINDVSKVYEKAKIRFLYHCLCAGANYNDWNIKEVFFDYKNIEIAVVLECYKKKGNGIGKSKFYSVVSYPFEYTGDNILVDFIVNHVYFSEEPVDEILSWNDINLDTSNAVRMENTVTYVYCCIANYLKQYKPSYIRFKVRIIPSKDFGDGIWDDKWFMSNYRIFGSTIRVTATDLIRDYSMNISHIINPIARQNKVAKGATAVNAKLHNSKEVEELLIKIYDNSRDGDGTQLFDNIRRLKRINGLSSVYDKFIEDMISKAADLGEPRAISYMNTTKNNYKEIYSETNSNCEIHESLSDLNDTNDDLEHNVIRKTDYINACYDKFCSLSSQEIYAEEAVVNARHILETIVQYYIAKFAPSHIIDSTFDCIKLLDDLGVLNKHYISVMHEVRRIGNKGAHASGEEISFADLNQVKLWLEELIELYNEE